MKKVNIKISWDVDQDLNRLSKKFFLPSGETYSKDELIRYLIFNLKEVKNENNK